MGASDCIPSSQIPSHHYQMDYLVDDTVSDFSLATESQDFGDGVLYVEGNEAYEIRQTDEEETVPYVSYNSILYQTCRSKFHYFQIQISQMQENKESSSSMAMSTAFNAYNDAQSDVVLISEDGVHFFVRRQRLLCASTSRFAFLLNPYQDARFPTSQEPIQLSENAETLNIVLHILYGISFRVYAPPLETLLLAIRTLSKYGIPLEAYVVPETPLFDDILLKMPFQPMEVYIVAAEYDLFELARAASTYLLSFPLLTMPRAISRRLNSDYISMLYNLHISRMRVLQRLIAVPPSQHNPTYACGYSEYQNMKSAWTLTAAQFIINAEPGGLNDAFFSCLSCLNSRIDVSAALIRNTLESVQFSLRCAECQKCVQRRVSDVLLKWSLTPVRSKRFTTTR